MVSLKRQNLEGEGHHSREKTWVAGSALRAHQWNNILLSIHQSCVVCSCGGWWKQHKHNTQHKQPVLFKKPTHHDKVQAKSGNTRPKTDKTNPDKTTKKQITSIFEIKTQRLRLIRLYLSFLLCHKRKELEQQFFCSA